MLCHKGVSALQHTPPQSRHISESALSPDRTLNVMFVSTHLRGWSGGAMVQGKLPVPGRPTIWIQ